MQKSSVALAAVGLLAVTCTAHADLLAYFPFDTSTPSDASGNGVAISNFGATWTSSGYSGGAFSFDGVDDFMRAELDINTAALPQLTMGAWVRPSVGSAIRQVISHDDSNFDRSLGIDTRGGGGTTWSAFTGSGVTSSGQDITLDEWVFLAVVYDQPAGTLRLHVGATNSSATTNFNEGWTFTYIGDNPSFTEHFGGLIDEVFFFNQALTVEQVEDIRLNGVPSPGALGVLSLAGLAASRRRRA